MVSAPDVYNTLKYYFYQDGVTIVPDDVKYKQLETVRTNDIEY